MKETVLRQLARWASGLRLDQIPPRVREHAVNQMLSTWAAVYSGWESDLGGPLEQGLPTAVGPARILPTGMTASCAQAAMLMASWSMVLDYDDVMLGGHTGHSSVLVPLALGSAGGKTGADLVLAQIAANEVAARVNMVCALGSTRGQMATHLHLLAAAAARAKIEELDEDQFADALAFALAQPSQTLYSSFLGSDAKAVSAGLSVRVGMEAVDAVKAGLIAPTDPLEGTLGFFAQATRSPVREFLGGLGERWHTETNSYKIYPVCGYLCSALDATLELAHEHDVDPSEVESVEVWASLFTIGMDAHSSPYLAGPRSRISTLTFSTPFTVASALIAREFGPDQLKRSWIEDDRVWQLAARVKSRHDVRLSLEAMKADIPLGAALRRARPRQAAAFGWRIAAAAFGRGGRWRRWATLKLMVGLTAGAWFRQPLDFERSTKPMGARVEIQLANGRRLRREVSIPRGFAGAAAARPTEPSVRELMRDKFIASASRAIGSLRAKEAMGSIEQLESLSAVGLRRLLDLSCLGQSESAEHLGEYVSTGY